MSFPAYTQPARSITEQTGWKRLMPQSICQDSDALERVSEYSFDIDNADFVRYFTDRTGVILDDQHPSVIRRQEQVLLLTPPTPFALMKQFCVMDDEEYLRTPLLVYKYDQGGKELPPEQWRLIPKEERNLRQHRILRGKLQDCWELYTHATPAITLAQLVGFGGAA